MAQIASDNEDDISTEEETCSITVTAPALDTYQCLLPHCLSIGTLVNMKCSQVYSGIWDCFLCKRLIVEDEDFYSCTQCDELCICSYCGPQETQEVQGKQVEEQQTESLSK